MPELRAPEGEIPASERCSRAGCVDSTSTSGQRGLSKQPVEQQRSHGIRDSISF